MNNFKKVSEMAHNRLNWVGIDLTSVPAKFGDPGTSRTVTKEVYWSESMYSCNLAPKWHHCQKIVKKWHQAVKLHFFAPNSTFDVPDRFNRSISRSPANFKKIGEGHILPYHVTWSHRLKIAIFKTCSDSLNMGRVCSVSMPVVTLQSFKMIGGLKVR